MNESRNASGDGRERGPRDQMKKAPKPTSPPTPVRQSLKPVEGPSSEIEPRPFTVDAEEWVARLGGASQTGRHTDPGALLIHVTFHRVAEPEVPVRETLVVGRSLDVVGDDELPDLFRQARPYKEPAVRERPRRGRGRRK